MTSQQRCHVIGLKDNGEQVVITGYISREHAEKIIELIEDNTPFAKLSIECHDAPSPSERGRIA